MSGTEIVNGWGVYEVVSFLVVAIGIGTWLTSWQSTTPLLPRNRRRNAAYPRLLHYTLVAKRIGFWAMVVGLANFSVAIVLEAVTS